MARIGLLEDNERIAKLCSTMLTFAGHEVVIYEEAFVCLRALFVMESACLPTLSEHTHALPIDVLILDLHLPGMTGLDALHLLCTHSRTRTLPLIFCTAATTPEIHQALQIAPGAIVVEKPFKLQVLMGALVKALAGPQA